MYLSLWHLRTVSWGISRIICSVCLATEGTDKNHLAFWTKNNEVFQPQGKRIPSRIRGNRSPSLQAPSGWYWVAAIGAAPPPPTRQSQHLPAVEQGMQSSNASLPSAFLSVFGYRALLLQVQSHYKLFFTITVILYQQNH